MQTQSDIKEPDTPPPASQTAGSEPGPRRRRSGPEERRALLDELEAGGLSAREFARQRDIGYQTLLSWRRKRWDLSGLKVVEEIIAPPEVAGKRSIEPLWHFCHGFCRSGTYAILASMVRVAADRALIQLAGSRASSSLGPGLCISLPKNDAESS